jgi:hypothetical protein
MCSILWTWRIVISQYVKCNAKTHRNQVTEILYNLDFWAVTLECCFYALSCFNDQNRQQIRTLLLGFVIRGSFILYRVRPDAEQSLYILGSCSWRSMFLIIPCWDFNRCYANVRNVLVKLKVYFEYIQRWMFLCRHVCDFYGLLDETWELEDIFRN